MKYNIGDYVLYDKDYCNKYYKFVYRIIKISDNKFYYKLLYTNVKYRKGYFNFGSDVYRYGKIISKDEVYMELL